VAEVKEVVRQKNYVDLVVARLKKVWNLCTKGFPLKQGFTLKVRIK
jgi:hypothetical protein